MPGRATIWTIAPAPGAGEAQVGDRLAALGDRQQHRVERQQEPEQRADRGEQLAGEVARPQRLVEQRDVLIGRRDRQTSGRERLQAAADRRCLTGRALHEDAGDVARQPGETLQARERHHRHERARHRTGGFGAEHGRDAASDSSGPRSWSGTVLAPGPDVSMPSSVSGRPADPDPAGDERVQRQRTRQPVERSRDSTSVPATSTVTRRPSGASTVARLLQQRRGLLDPADRFHPARACLRRSLRSSARAAAGSPGPTTACTTWPVEPAMLRCATVAASTSATATAMPTPRTAPRRHVHAVACGRCTAARRAAASACAEGLARRPAFTAQLIAWTHAVRRRPTGQHRARQRRARQRPTCRRPARRRAARRRTAVRRAACKRRSASRAASVSCVTSTTAAPCSCARPASSCDRLDAAGAIEVAGRLVGEDQPRVARRARARSRRAGARRRRAARACAPRRSDEAEALQPRERMLLGLAQPHAADEQLQRRVLERRDPSASGGSSGR